MSQCPPDWSISEPRRRIVLRATTLLTAALLSACASLTSPPSARVESSAGASAPRQTIWPVRRYIANVDVAGGFSLSPDGRLTANSEAVGLGAGITVRDAATGEVQSRLSIGLPMWLGDSRHPVHAFDPRGDENLRIGVRDTRSADGAPWEVTPWPGVRSIVVGRGATPTTFLFVSNRTDRRRFDLFEADAATRSIRELRQADLRTQAWLIDAQAGVVGEIRRESDAKDPEGRLVVRLQSPDGSSRTLTTVGPFDTWIAHRFDLATKRAWVSTNVDRDRVELVEVDLDDGRETVLGAHPVVDVDGPVFEGRHGAPIAWSTMDGLPVLHALDADAVRKLAAIGYRARSEGLIDDDPVITVPQSSSDDGTRQVVTVVSRLDRAEVLWDGVTDTLRRLDRRDDDASFRKSLSPWEPVSFPASDGRRLHGLLLRPKGVTGPVPLVIDIHGGPWTRDRWSPATPNLLQMLTNRGYAVLQVNYRGSSGYGREHLLAASRAYGDRLRHDIADGVRWAIDAGIADRERLAVMGASFGGYSTLMQLIEQPHPYRCGVSIVGVANWPRTIAAWPPYWTNRSLATRFYGRVDDPADQAEMMRQSPIARLDRITAPLLVAHGEADVRVLQQDSVDVVRSLRARGIPVRYLSFPDEGHDIRWWRNRLALAREIDDHLADCLGGPSAGFDLFEWMPSRVKRDVQ